MRKGKLMRHDPWLPWFFAWRPTPDQRAETGILNRAWKSHWDWSSGSLNQVVAVGKLCIFQRWGNSVEKEFQESIKGSSWVFAGSQDAHIQGESPWCHGKTTRALWTAHSQGSHRARNHLNSHLPSGSPHWSFRAFGRQPRRAMPS